MVKTTENKLKDNLMFVGTIYDSFDALEETLGKLKLEKPLFITHIAKMAFAKEVFNCVHQNPHLLYDAPPKASHPQSRLYN